LDVAVAIESPDADTFDCLSAGGELGALIRATDWSKTPVGSVEGWPQSLRTALGILLHSGCPMYIAWGPQFIQFYNDAYRPILGSKHPAALGRSAAETFEETWDSIGPTFQEIMERGSASTCPDQPLPLGRNNDGEESYFTYSYSPILNEQGGIGGVFVAAIDTTDRVLRERRSKKMSTAAAVVSAIGETKAQQSNSGQPEVLAMDRANFALTAGRLGYWELDLPTRKLFSSDLCKANFGRSPAEEFSYATLIQATHPDDRAGQQHAVEQAVASAGNLDMEFRVIWPDDSVHWLRVLGDVIYDANGTPLQMAGISLDITDRKHVENTLREETRTLETLHRIAPAIAGKLDLESVVQTATDAARELSGARFGAFFYNLVDDKGESYTLYTLSGVSREAFAKFPMPRNTAIFAPTFTGAGIVRSGDIRKDPRYGKSGPHFGMPEGHLPVASYLAVPVVSRSGEVLGGLFFGHERPDVFSERAERIVTGIAAQAAIAIDNARLFQAAQSEIGERRRAEEQLKLLLAELNHRVKNTLAIVQSIAGHTLRHADSAEAFRVGFEARIMALSEAHNLLTDTNWEGASPRDILERVLTPYSQDEAGRYTLTGPDIMAGPKVAVSLVMAFHELATNAAKYGALSNSTGHVEVDWSVTEGSQPRTLHVNWREAGGPPVKVPRKKGFGSRLINSLSNETYGKVRMEFARTGLVCAFSILFPSETMI
jgi:two-component sensor histidine kinase/PAS domain-containing protein